MFFRFFKKKEKILVEKVVTPKTEVKKELSKDDKYKMFAGKNRKDV